MYHIRKGGEEDTATKKKIALVGTVVFMLMAALEIPNLLNMLNMLNILNILNIL